jgi:nucleoside-diphosphate-sugar epimerase
MKKGIIIGGNGYIGSQLQKTLDYDIIDYGWYESKRCLSHSPFDYETIILLAGHSSIWMCENDPSGSWANNIDYFKKIVNNLKENQTLIYASSASVYGSTDSIVSEDYALARPKTHYDLQKNILDLITLNEITHGKNIIGLRFGTVNGISPHTRVDLMINSMVFDAVTKNIINMANPNKKRALLFIDDLCRGIKLASDKKVSGVYNLSSVNISVEEVAQLVSKKTNAKINTLEMVNPFSFELDSSKFIDTFGSYKNQSIESVIDDLSNNITSVRKTRRDRF